MANRTLSCKVLHVAKTTAQWASESSVVTKGMLCVEFTTDNKTRLKVGDGLKSFADLPYSDGNVDLTNYYTKSETDTAVSNAVTALGTIMTIKGVVSSFNNLPASNNSTGDVYFVPQNNSSTNDAYLEYVWVVPTSGTPAWEYIGKVEQTIDLSGYATITYVDTQIATLTASAHTHSNKTILDNTTASFTTDLNTKLTGIATGAEVNQNAFSNVTVGSTTISADSKTDTLTLVAGSNITITPDATNDKITIAATDTTYSAATTSANGLMSSTDKVKLDGIAAEANKTIVDSALNSTSTNPVQNKIINAELADKLDIDDTLILQCNI